MSRIEASMRPRLFTAENIDPGALDVAGSCASMRPRLFTAENNRRSNAACKYLGSFNEAAAFHRGEPSSTRTSWYRWCRFNEAAAFHRGELTVNALDNGAIKLQ